MMPYGRLLMSRLFLGCAVAALLVPAVVSAAEYNAVDNGRTARQQMPAAFPATGGDPHAGHNHGPAAPAAESSAPAVFEVSPSDLYFPAVEKALQESGVDRLAVQNEGMLTSLRTFAEIQVHAITGRSRFKGQDPVFTVLGMIYQKEAWVRCPVLPVENAGLAKVFGLDPKTHNWVSPVWVMKTPKARTLVMGALAGDDAFSAQLDADTQKALKKFAFRAGSFLNLPGELKLVPLANSDGFWLAPIHLQNPALLRNPELEKQVAALNTSEEPFASVLQLDTSLKAAFDEQKAENLGPAVAGALANLEATPGYMSGKVRALDFWNTRVKPFQKSSWLFFAAFVGFLVYMLTAKKNVRRDGSDGHLPDPVDGRTEEYAPGAREYMQSGPTPASGFAAVSNLLGRPVLASEAGGMAMPAGGFGEPVSPAGAAAGFRSGAGYGDPLLEAERDVPVGNRKAWIVGYTFMSAAAAMLVGALVVRFILGGRMPVSNMYESITFAMGAFAIVAVIFEGVYRRGWAGVGASFAGWGLMVLANSMPLHSRKVEPLVAVLNSVWLNFHVTSLLISYSCFLMAFVFGVLFYVKDLSGNKPGVLPRAQAFEYLTYRSVQIGWPLLTLGIFLGAVWANTAWGSFWSWDPKETWALITWLVYTIYLHLRINLGWTGRKAVAASMIGFLMMLITYFGVSYLPGLAGGMHSYAEPIKRS